MITTEKNSLINAIKNKCVKKWFYEFKNGHPILLKEECDIICKLRFDKSYSWMNDDLIKELIKDEVKLMYKEKFPNAKKWSLPLF